MEYLFIYLLQMAGKLEVLCGCLIPVIIILTLIASGILGSSQCSIEEIFNKDVDNEHEVERNSLIWIKNLIVICASLFIIINLLPTKQTLLLMGGTYLGKRAVNSIVDSGKFEKINTIIDLQLDKYIDELKGEAK